MGYIEATIIELAHGHTPRETLARATDARLEFAADANCASIKGPPDTPPPSAWPSVSRIRKETRAEVVAEIVKNLHERADEMEKSDPTALQRERLEWNRVVAAYIETKFAR